MSTLSERLRERAALINDYRGGVNAHLMKEAADEIDRLNADLEQCRKTGATE